MAARILTLFGEEIVPEELGAARSMGEAKEPGQPFVLEGWTPEKHYYSIGEVARLFGVRTSNIRYWTNEFELKPRTTRKGDRLYTPEDIQQLRGIYHLLRERGFTIAGAKARLAEEAAISQRLELRNTLLRLRNQLVEIRNQLL
jgi:DNA-binding transcriptional MerR regulator